MTHGPEDECATCGECPACDGVGSGGSEDVVVHTYGSRYLGLQCARCAGSGVVCPNYEPKATA